MTIFNKLVFTFFWGSMLVVSFAATTPYILAQGDTLEIKVINKPELDTRQSIAPDGSISLPSIGRMNANGLSIDELQKKVREQYSLYIRNADVVIFLTPRPIYVVQHDPKKQTWEVKEAKSPQEAIAYMGQSGNQLEKYNLQAGDVVTVSYGKAPDFWEDNWYKVLTAMGVVAGVWNVLR